VLSKFPRIRLAHTPTPLEPMGNVTRELGGARYFVKRDDCTGLAMGGNKARQLEFYLGEALTQGCDSVISTGATQSNFLRMLAAAACRLGMQCHLQLENRVANMPDDYHTSGNVLLDKVLGAKLYHYPQGEDEHGADAQLREIGERLRAHGRRPYVIALSPDNPPKGALGYVDAARELLEQSAALGIDIDAVVVASGGAFTHSGLLVGLRLLGSRARVAGICVRRDVKAQAERVFAMATRLGEMLGRTNPVGREDVWLEDAYLGPGYGRVTPATLAAIDLAARCEGLLLDPVYTGKAFAGLIDLSQRGAFGADQNIVFLHTGGVPALFAYHDALFTTDRPREAGGAP
jgi:D-cysteine desulfhydrase family pyridoxal phosphate-dependent enzyme